MFHRGLPKTQRTVVNGAKAGREVVPGTERSHTLPPNGPVSWHTTTLRKTTKHNNTMTHNAHTHCRQTSNRPVSWHTTLTMIQWHNNTQWHNDTVTHNAHTHTHTPCNTNWPVSRHRTTYNKIQLHNDTQQNTRTRQNTTTQQHNTQTHYYYTLQHQTANGYM